MNKRVGVFCGRKSGERPEFEQAAAELGAGLARRGWGLVYGGANIGMMGTIANTVLAAGGEAIGVIPEPLVKKEVAHRGLSQLHVVPTLVDRKSKMIELADGFVVLPGGYGTLDELFEVLTLRQIGVLQKPVALVNTCGFFDPLLTFVQRASDSGFVLDEHVALLTHASEPEAVLELLDRHLDPPNRS